MEKKFIVSCEGNIEAVCDSIERCVNFICVMFNHEGYKLSDIKNLSKLEHDGIMEMMVGNFSIKKVPYWQ